MHFWIDKRSQSCGFGRARVSASLSGNGIGFGHHPRRIGGKSMVTPIHRFQAVDFRPHANRPTTTPSPAPSAGNHTHHHPPLPTTTHNQTNQQQALHHHHHHQPNQHLQAHLNGQNHQPLFNLEVSQHVASQHAQHHHQPHMFSHHMLQMSQQQSYSARSQQSYIQPQHPPQSPRIFQPECHVPIGHFGPIEVEPGTLNGITQITAAHSQLAQAASVNSNSFESQLMPGHFKCGMWASLALAIVFVAGHVNLVFQGTGYEVLIFCSFSVVLMMLAFFISVWRRQRELAAMAQSPIDQLLQLEQTQHQQPSPMVHQQQHLINQQQPHSLLTQHILEVPANESAAPPPPYHIAILLPDNDKEPDESPPPSYDKLQI